MNWVYVFMGGGAGAVMRFGVQLWLGKPNGHHFPWSTFLVNIAGCCLIGVCTALSLKFKWHYSSSLFLMTGILGGFTTFSAFSMDFVEMAKNNHMGLALLYAGLTNFVGLSVTAIGYSLLK